METGNPEDAERYAKCCMATYQPVAHRSWFLYCTLPLRPWHRSHVAHDTGGVHLMAWTNTSPDPEAESPST